MLLILVNPARWTEAGQAELLDFMSSTQGVKMLYDSFFKEVMNPMLVPERLEELISLLLKQDMRPQIILYRTLAAVVALFVNTLIAYG